MHAAVNRGDARSNRALGAADFFRRSGVRESVLTETKRCKDCCRERPLTSFKLLRSGNSRLGICTSCMSSREYRANPARFLRKAALKRAKYPHLSVLSDCRKADKKRGRVGNDLDRTFVKEALDEPCRYCGNTQVKMTLDRLDNTLAHTKANVVPACMRCNYIKNSMPHAAWLHIAPAVREAVTLGLFGDWRSTPFNKRHTTSPEEVAAFEKLTTEERSEINSLSAPRVPKFFWPSLKELAAEVEASSLRVVAARLGCSHVAVGRRLGRYRKSV